MTQDEFERGYAERSRGIAEGEMTTDNNGIEILRYFEAQGRSAAQLAEELFALAGKPAAAWIAWTLGLNEYEKLVTEAIMNTFMEELGNEEQQREWKALGNIILQR